MRRVCSNKTGLEQTKLISFLRKSICFINILVHFENVAYLTYNYEIIN